jgi:hypothetical protein
MFALRDVAVLAMLASAPPPMASQPDWYIVDPSTSSCVKPAVSPQDFETELRGLGKPVISRGIGRNPDGSVRTITVRYKVQGEDDGTVVFWASLASCQAALQRLTGGGG